MLFTSNFTSKIKQMPKNPNGQKSLQHDGWLVQERVCLIVSLVEIGSHLRRTEFCYPSLSEKYIHIRVAYYNLWVSFNAGHCIWMTFYLRQESVNRHTSAPSG